MTDKMQNITVKTSLSFKIVLVGTHPTATQVNPVKTQKYSAGSQTFAEWNHDVYDYVHTISKDSQLECTWLVTV